MEKIAMTTMNDATRLMVARRRADLHTAAVAYAITRIRDFTDNGKHLTPSQITALRSLIEEAERDD